MAFEKRARLRAGGPSPDDGRAETKSSGLAAWREARRRNPLIGDRDLGDFQAQVLLEIGLDSGKASSLSILDFIVRGSGRVPDHAQTHGISKELSYLIQAVRGRSWDRRNRPRAARRYANFVSRRRASRR